MVFYVKCFVEIFWGDVFIESFDDGVRDVGIFYVRVFFRGFGCGDECVCVGVVFLDVG